MIMACRSELNSKTSGSNDSEVLHNLNVHHAFPGLSAATVILI